MPRVTISVTAPGSELDNELLTLELPPNSTIQDLKGFIEAETNLPSATQSIFFNGQPVTNDTQTLETAGIRDGEMLAVMVRRPQPTRPNASQPAMRPDRPDPEGVRQQLLMNPEAQNQLRQQDPELAAAANDPVRWREAFEMKQRQAEEAQRNRQEYLRKLTEDPFNVEAQREIEDMIRQENVVNNLQKAYEQTPEAFVRVHMLYVNTEVNGIPVKAFVDSGAQATIMSPDCAERCGIMRLLDIRYAGMARGVGTAKILGRVHAATMKIGGAEIPCSFTVMEGKDVDLLFGLDMLKRYRAKIDLEKNALCLEGIEVPFLHESEIPKSFEEAEVNEPTVPGPNNTEIGARSGAVRPAGTSGGDSSAAAGPSGTQPSPAAAAPASQPTASQPASAAPAASGNPQEEKIQQLISIAGCSRQQAIQALEASGGDIEIAAGFLFG